MKMGRNKKQQLAFPAARIKRMMQCDEDIGKVAIHTPVLVAKALEALLEDLIHTSGEAASSQRSATITPQHLKSCIENNEDFDFLRSLVEKVPDVAPQDTSEEKEEMVDAKEETEVQVPKKRKSMDNDDPDYDPASSKTLKKPKATQNGETSSMNLRSTSSTAQKGKNQAAQPMNGSSISARAGASTSASAGASTSASTSARTSQTIENDAAASIPPAAPVQASTENFTSVHMTENTRSVLQTESSQKGASILPTPVQHMKAPDGRPFQRLPTLRHPPEPSPPLGLLLGAGGSQALHPRPAQPYAAQLSLPRIITTGSHQVPTTQPDPPDPPPLSLPLQAAPAVAASSYYTTPSAPYVNVTSLPQGALGSHGHQVYPTSTQPDPPEPPPPLSLPLLTTSAFQAPRVYPATTQPDPPDPPPLSLPLASAAGLPRSQMYPASTQPDPPEPPPPLSLPLSSDSRSLAPQASRMSPVVPVRPPMISSSSPIYSSTPPQMSAGFSSISSTARRAPMPMKLPSPSELLQGQRIPLHSHSGFSPAMHVAGGAAYGHPAPSGHGRLVRPWVN